MTQVVANPVSERISSQDGWVDFFLRLLFTIVFHAYLDVLVWTPIHSLYWFEVFREYKIEKFYEIFTIVVFARHVLKRMDRYPKLMLKRFWVNQRTDWFDFNPDIMISNHQVEQMWNEIDRFYIMTSITQH